MKRVLLIFFVLVAAVGACFAAPNDTLILTTSIKAETPDFQIKGAYGATPATYTGTATIDLEETSPAATDIVLDVSIFQYKVARYLGEIDLAIEATPFKNDDLPSQKTDAPTVTDSSTLTGVDYINVSNFAEKIDADTGNRVVSFKVSYEGPKVDKDKTIASWKLTWPNKPELASGDYTATITLKYTAV